MENYLKFLISSCYLVFMKVTGLPHGQEKSGKTKKNDKSQVKMGVFKKTQENFFRKPEIFSVQIYQILKAFK